MTANVVTIVTTLLSVVLPDPGDRHFCIAWPILIDDDEFRFHADDDVIPEILSRRQHVRDVGYLTQPSVSIARAVTGTELERITASDTSETSLVSNDFISLPVSTSSTSPDLRDNAGWTHSAQDNGGKSRRRMLERHYFRRKNMLNNERRHRRAASIVPFVDLPDVVEIKSDVKHVIDDYFQWRRNHPGYGRMTRRWGK